LVSWKTPWEVSVFSVQEKGEKGEGRRENNLLVIVLEKGSGW
jgi:hypothetical protein